MSESQSAIRCLVLGGSGYVGQAVVRNLHRAGAQVAFSYHRSEDVARSLEEELPGVRGFRADLESYDEARRVVREGIEHLGGLDTLVQCAGDPGDPELYECHFKGTHERLHRIDPESFSRMWAVTVQSTLAACQEAAGTLVANSGGGNIVVVGSMDGVKPLPAPVHYATVKGAVRSLVESLAKELGNDQVRVNMVAPGILEGGMARHLADELREPYLEHCSLERMGTADEVAELVGWLATENTYVTAQSILLDGGL